MFPFDLDALYPVIQTLGWTLIHFLWQGAAIGALFAAGMLLMRGAHPNTRYAFGLFNMALLALSPLVTFWLLWPESQAAVAAGEAVSLGVFAAQAPVAESSWSVWVESGLPWVVLAWISGVVLLSLRVLVNWRRMRRLTRIGVNPLSADLMAQVDVLCQLFGIRRAVTVLESTIVKVPTVLGWLKPVVLLPTSSLMGLTPGQLELVIAHELGHIRRLDYVVNLFQVFVETTLFYHPAVGWISRRIREEREKCCDDLVIQTCGNRLEYAKALTNLETIRSGSLSPALAATDGQLLQRIERIVCHHAARPRDAVAGNSMVLIVIASAILIAGQMADPFARMEQERGQLAESLVAELFTPSVSEQGRSQFASLENARGTYLEPEPTAPARSAAPDPLTAQSVTDPSAATGKVIAEERTFAAQTVRKEPVPIATVEVSAQPIAQPVTLASAPMDNIEPLYEQLAGAPIAAPALLERETAPAATTTWDGPAVVKRVAPDYPVRARIAGQEGYVTVEFEIRGDGRATEVRIVDAEPRRVFDKAAKRAIRGWRFDANTLAGHEERRFTQRFDFSLSGGVANQSADAGRNCIPVTGTRICRTENPTSLLSQEAVGG